MLPLELLAPARNLEIGIAAIDCGADAVYIAGPAFGARQAAGNSVEDIAALCAYARPFGVRIFVTLNTILYNEELEEARRLIRALEAAGVDGLIVQDLAVPALAGAGTPLRLHASTQCAIRTPETARRYEAMGFSRLVLERELSLEQVRAIREAVSCELEFFVHGALCVCYSGQCYLSEALTGRSANRGACAQACRSRYDLVDADGKVLVRNKALLSLKDYNLLRRVGELADAGVCSFKIEGRLKGITYVKNTVRAYSEALDELVRRSPDRYRRASFGRVSGGFVPDLTKTFNRGYTELFFDGERRRGWSSMDAPTPLGEPVGRVRTVSPGRIELQDVPAGIRLRNGDGFAFPAPDGEVVGFRGDVCDGVVIRGDIPSGLRNGTTLFRNSDGAFEKAVESGRCIREIPVEMEASLSSQGISVTARSEDGREIHLEKAAGGEPARDRERLLALVRSQLGKRAGHYAFRVTSTNAADSIPMMPASFLNALRREAAEALDAFPVRVIPLGDATPAQSPVPGKSGPTTPQLPATATYKDNISNDLARLYYSEHGTSSQEDAYELTHRSGAELMRTKYCIRFELGLCPVRQGARDPGPIFLLNNGRRFPLRFDCRACEMVVGDAPANL